MEHAVVPQHLLNALRQPDVRVLIRQTAENELNNAM